MYEYAYIRFGSIMLVIGLRFGTHNKSRTDTVVVVIMGSPVDGIIYREGRPPP